MKKLELYKDGIYSLQALRSKTFDIIEKKNIRLPKVIKKQITALCAMNSFLLQKGIPSSLTLSNINENSFEVFEPHELKLAIHNPDLQVQEYFLTISVIDFSFKGAMIHKEAFDEGFNSDFYVIFKDSEDLDELPDLKQLDYNILGFVVYNDIYKATIKQQKNRFGKLEEYYFIDESKFRKSEELFDIIEILETGDDPTDKYSYMNLEDWED